MSVPTVEPAARAEPKPFLKTPPGQALQAIASLRLTVTLFALSMVLVFVGTLAQMDYGLNTVLKNYFRSWVVAVPFQLFVRLGQVFLGIDKSTVVGGAFPFPGGWTIGGLLLLNLLAAHLIRFKLSWKRAGIIMLHAGVIVLLLGELVTGLFAVESRMTITEGESSDFSYRIHECELVLIDRSDPKIDNVIAISQSRLERRGLVNDPQLPVDVEVASYMRNSELARPSTAASNLATAGEGLRMTAVEVPEHPGTTSTVDIPAAYIRLKEKGGAVVGTYMVRTEHEAQPIDVAGKPYQLALRFRRDYKPYRLHLIEFRFDRYQGTDIAKNYSSLVRLTDPARDVNREVLIRMNEPLRYDGDALYQASFDENTEQTTVLQVVRNPAWTWPYVACSLVALGMVFHFGLHLLGFLQRRVA